jgi:hypothetical protein
LIRRTSFESLSTDRLAKHTVKSAENERAIADPVASPAPTTRQTGGRIANDVKRRMFGKENVQGDYLGS